MYRYHPRWIPSNHLHPMPASLPWVLQRPDSRSTKESPGLRFCGACGSTNGSTIQPSQITRSQQDNTFFCQTNIAVSNHPCSCLPQHILIPLQRRSTDHPITKPTTPAEPPRATTVRKCPECKRCLDQVRSPLVCVACRQQFHVKCARETQLALQSLRGADAWTCHICAEGHQPTGRPDPTPVLNGFDAVRRDRPGSGARIARGGGLLTYIKKGIPYSEVPAAQQGPLEKLHVTIPTTHRQYLTIANVYFPPVSSNYVQPMEDRQTWVDTLEARGPSVICGDFNTHHVSWDEYAQGMPRGAELYNWVEENEMAMLNDGKPTRAARFQQGCRRAARELQSGVRRPLGSPRQELEQAFTPEELATTLKTDKAGKAGGPDGVAPDLLKHLPLNKKKNFCLS